MKTLQAEDEIAAASIAIGAAFAGALGVTGTSGPGRRPQVGGDGPRDQPRAAAASSSTCSAAVRPPACPPRPSRPTCCSRCTAVTASRRCRSSRRSRRRTASTPRSRRARIAVKYRTPVILLTDGYLANGAEPWLLPDVDALPDISVRVRHRAEPRRRVLAVPARPRDAGPTVGDPGHARPRAPHRRHREGRRHRQHQLLAREPRAHGARPRRRRSPASPTTSRGVDARRRRRRRGARARLGQHVGRDHRPACGGSAPAASKVAHAHLMHLNPFPRDLGDVLRPLPQGARARDEPRPARRLVRAEYLVDAQSLHEGAGRAVPGRRDGSQDPGDDRLDDRHEAVALTRKDFESDQEVALVPGLRRLRHPRRHPVPAARARREARRDGVRLGHRLRGAVAVLHEHLRRARHPRPGAGGRHRCRAGPPRPARVGDRRRRRHAVDRRQPPDPRAAPQREPEDPDVQQPDLRADEGSVLADVGARQGHQVDAVRLDRPPVQPDVGRARRRGRRSSPARTTSTAST